MLSYRSTLYRFITRTVSATLVLTMFVGLNVFVGLNAEEKPKRKPGQTKTKANRSIQDIEAILEEPSRLTFDESKRITLAELFQKVSAEHGLQVRVDKNLASLLAVGRESMLVAEGEIPGGQQSGGIIHGGVVSYSFPVQVAPVYAGTNVIADQNPRASSNGSAPPSTTSPNAQYLEEPVTYLPHPTSVAASPKPVPPTPEQPVVEPSIPVQESQQRELGTIRVQKPIVEEDQNAESEVPNRNENEEVTGEAEVAKLQLSSRVIEMLLETEITTLGLTQPGTSLESVLLHSLDHVTTMLDIASVEGEMPIPFHATHAYDLTLLFKNDHVLVTTVAAANLCKTTKVYSVEGLGEIDADQLATVITKTIRPWSWRNQINVLVEQVSADWPDSVAIPKINIDLTGVSTAENSSDHQSDSTTEVDLTSLKTMGQLLSSGTIAAAHTLISGTEMLHYADPPTADIETLPGMLVITQSQGAHREIDDLLTQLKNATSIKE